MLDRRTFLTTIAAAPLAKFCKTEPVRTWQIAGNRRGFIDISSGKPAWRLKYRVEPKAVVERRYNLPPGTLG